MILPVKGVAALSPYVVPELEADEGDASLSRNESAFPPSPRAIAAARELAPESRIYPDPNWTELRKAIAEVHGLDRELILCGMGSMELIACLVRAYAAAGDEVLATDHCYAFVPTAAAQAGARIARAREIDFTVSADRIAEAVTPATRIAFVCNPGNPTGTAIPNSEIVRLRAMLPDDLLLVIDQAYGEFTDASDSPKPAFDLAGLGNTVVLRTFSKAYSLAGARVGWGIFPPAVGRQVRKLLLPNSVAAASQAMALAAVRDQGHMRRTVAKTAELRDGFREQAMSLGIESPASRTNFVLLKFPGVEAADAADRALKAEGLRLRRISSSGLPECLRATVCPAPVMDRVLGALRKAMR